MKKSNFLPGFILIELTMSLFLLTTVVIIFSKTHKVMTNVEINSRRIQVALGLLEYQLDNCKKIFKSKSSVITKVKGHFKHIGIKGFRWECMHNLSPKVVSNLMSYKIKTASFMDQPLDKMLDHSFDEVLRKNIQEIKSRVTWNYLNVNRYVGLSIYARK